MEDLPEASPPPSRHHSPTKCDKTPISLLTSRRRRTIAFAYAFTFAFVSCTVFLLFNSSFDSSSWLNNFLKTRSHFSSIFSYIFPNSSSSSFSSPSNSSLPLFDKNQMFSGSNVSLHSPSFSLIQDSTNKSQNNCTFLSNEASNGSLKVNVGNQPDSALMSDDMETRALEKPSDDDLSAMRRKADLLGLMNNCNAFDGRWEKDDSYPLYAPGSCPQVDKPFNCFLNNRPDSEYEKYRWQPNHCNIPRLNGGDMLEMLRGKRLVFVGDSLNRNMWESLVCILRNSMKDKSRVFEASGRHEFRTEGSYSYVFKDYNCSIEFFRSPFLVQEWERLDRDGIKQTLRLDVIERSAEKYKSADILVFNTGHWWTHEKTSKGKGYYQEGNHIYGELNVKEAFRKALTTWGRWVDANVNAKKTLVFFRGYSVSHFRGGRWNSGGQCDGETEPIKNEAYLASYPSKMRILESVMKGMKTSVIYMNMTRLTDFRKDAHPSIYRKPNLTEEERRSPSRYQDCSHWCLPGIPDTWNELLYAQLLIEQNQKLKQQNQE